MALINCSECGKEISDKAAACPNCGAPISVSKGIVTDNQTSNYIPNKYTTKNETTHFSGGRTVVSAKKKVNTGCLLFLIIFIGATIFGIIQTIKNPDSYQTTNKTTNASKKDNKKSLLEFDEQSWDDFKILYESHNNFMKSISEYSDSQGQISSLDFYNICTRAKDYFAKASTAFDYGTNDDEKNYLSSFELVALADQQAAEKLIKYIDSGKTSDLSKAQEQIQRASDALVTIAENRGVLLVKAGLSEKEIQEKVEKDMEELESETSK